MKISKLANGIKPSKGRQLFNLAAQYTVAHYCFAQKICNEEMNGVRIYNLKTLLTITGAFMISGFLLMMTYNAPVIRYGLLVIAGVLAVLNRNKIIALLKSLIAMKKA